MGSGNAPRQAVPLVIGTMASVPRVSFGIIALNAQPFLEYNLRALYPFAHQLLVVEGATSAARSLATAQGHSQDETMDMLLRFQEKEDPENKLQIITAKDRGYSDGFWPEKDDMSHAYSERITGDWLWQVDSDEFYKIEDMHAVLSILDEDPDITAVSFPYYEFFGGFDYVITGKWQLVEYPLIPRLFRWKTGYKYLAHRPATVVNESGKDLRAISWVRSPKNGNSAILLFHYSYVFPKQAAQKVGYYSNVDWTDSFRGNQKWLDESFFKLAAPLFLGERGKPILQWLERYRGPHPELIDQLREDIRQGIVREPLRRTEDIEALLASPGYRLTTWILHRVMPWFWRARRWWKTRLMGKDTET